LLNSKKYSRIVLQYFLTLLVFITITADRNLIISHFIGFKTNIYITSIFLLVLLFRYLPEFIISASVRYNKHLKNLLITLLLISSYFLIHYIIFPTSFIPLKYSILSILLIVLIINRIKIDYIINGFAIIGFILSFILLFQQLLLFLFHGGSLSEFDLIIKGSEVLRWSIGYVSPYNFGLIEYSTVPMLDLNSIVYYRPTLFTHEPKHASSILLLTLSTVLLSKYSNKTKKLMICIHLLSIFLIMSISSYLMLLITLSLYLMNKKKIFPVYYVSAVFIIPFTLTFLFVLIFPLLSDPNSILYLRIVSAVTTSGAMVEFTMPSLFASGAYPEIKHDRDSLLYYIYGQYGLVALILIAIFLFLLVKYINKQAANINFLSMQRFAIILLVNIFVVYNLYVFSDFLNLFSVSLIILIFHVLGNPKIIDKIKYNIAY